MKIDEFIGFIEELLELPNGILEPATELGKISGFDSLTVLSLISLAEEEGKYLTPEDFADVKSLADIFYLIQG